MAVTGLRKYFGEEDTFHTVATAWRRLSVRSAEYQWHQSGADANAYYLRRADGTIPDGLYAATYLAEMALGETVLEIGAWPLAAGQWRADDRDALGKNTLYVRLPSDISSPDPDDLPLDALTYRSVPTAYDAVLFDEDAGSVTGGLESVMSCAELHVAAGYSGLIGKEDQPLVIATADTMFLDGTGTCYLAFLPGQSIDPVVHIGSQGAQGPVVFLRSNYATTIVRIRSGRLFMPDRLDATSQLQALEVLGPARVVLDRGVTMSHADARILQVDGTAIYRHQMTAGEAIDIQGGQADFQEPFRMSGAQNVIQIASGGLAAVRTTQLVQKIRLASLRSTGPIPELDLNTGVKLNIGSVELLDGVVRVDARNSPDLDFVLSGAQEVRVTKL